MKLVGVAITTHALKRFKERFPAAIGSRPDVTMLRVLSHARPIGWKGPRAVARIRAAMKHQDPTEFWFAPGADLVFVVACEDGRRGVATCYRMDGEEGRNWEYLDRPITKRPFVKGCFGRQEKRG